MDFNLFNLLKSVSPDLMKFVGIFLAIYIVRKLWKNFGPWIRLIGQEKNWK